MKEVLFEKSKKEVIESVTIAGKKYELHEEYDLCFDGGVIVKITPKEEIVEYYKENGWEWDFRYSDDEMKECSFEDFGAQFDIRDRSGGYSVQLDKFGNELIEL